MPALEKAEGTHLRLQAHNTCEHQQNLSLSLCKDFYCALKKFLPYIDINRQKRCYFNTFCLVFLKISFWGLLI